MYFQDSFLEQSKAKGAFQDRGANNVTDKRP